MADIPVISITTEKCSDDEGISEKDLIQNQSNVNTDVENLDSNSSSDNGKNSTSLIAGRRKSSKKRHKILTDVEDMLDSDSEDDDKIEDQNYEIKLSLDEFLDHGYLDESAKYSGQSESMHDAKPQPKRPSPCLNVELTEAGGITDCENVEGSDNDESEKYDSEKEMNFFLEEPGTVASHDTLKSKMEVEHHLTDSSSSSSCNSSDEMLSPYHQKRSQKMYLALSDTENIVFSDYETQRSKSPKPKCSKRGQIPGNVELLTMQTSDNEDTIEDSLTSPVIDITFATKPKSCLKKKTVPKETNFLAVNQEDLQANTDVENLDSSDEEGASGLKIPVAFAKNQNAVFTDVEDVDSVESEEEIDQKPITLGNPVRQMILLKETTSGDPVCKIMPLSDSALLSANTGYLDQGLTDTEDMSDTNDDLYDIEKYNIEQVPDVDNGEVTSKDKVNLNIPNQYQDDPITDTEEMGCSKDSRKKRHKHRHTSCKNKSKHLMAAPKTEEAVTDVEEILLNERDSNHPKPKPVSQPKLLVIQTDEGAKTDVEFMSGDEDEIPFMGHRKSSPSILSRSCPFVSSVSSREGYDLQNSDASKRFLHCNIPTIRKMSPTPEGILINTDVEDIVSETDEGIYDLDRAQTATPMEVQKQMNESGSVVIDRIVNVFDEQMEKLNIKGHKEIQEATTDVEFLEDDNQN